MANWQFLNIPGLVRLWEDIKPKIDAKFGAVNVGSDTLTPTSSDDSITLTAGTNIAITPDTTTNSVTISSTGGDDHNLADEFDSQSTYTIGSYCIYSGDLYFCTTAITTPGSWDSTKWTKVLVTSTFRRIVELSLAQYNALTTEQQMDGTLYCITDSSGSAATLGFYLDSNGGLCEVNYR